MDFFFSKLTEMLEITIVFILHKTAGGCRSFLTRQILERIRPMVMSHLDYSLPACAVKPLQIVQKVAACRLINTAEDVGFTKFLKVQ